MKIFLLLLCVTGMLTAGCATPTLWGRMDYCKDLKLVRVPNTGEVFVRYREKVSWKSCNETPESQQFQPRTYRLLNYTNTAHHHLLAIVDPFVKWTDHWPEFVEMNDTNDWSSIPFLTKAQQKALGAPSPESEALRKTLKSEVSGAASLLMGLEILYQKLNVMVSARGCSLSTNGASGPPLLSSTNALPEHGYYAIERSSEFELWRGGQKLGTFQFPPARSGPAPVTVWRVVLTPPAALADTVMTVMVVGIATSPYWVQIFNH